MRCEDFLILLLEHAACLTSKGHRQLDRNPIYNWITRSCFLELPNGRQKHQPWPDKGPAKALRGSRRPKNTSETRIFAIYMCFLVFFDIRPERRPAGRGVGRKVYTLPPPGGILKFRPKGRRILVPSWEASWTQADTQIGKTASPRRCQKIIKILEP